MAFLPHTVKRSVGRYCSKDKAVLDLLVPIGSSSSYWEDKTLAECCRSNFPWPEAFRLCMGDPEDGVRLPPCSSYIIPDKWLYLPAERTCVKECIGEGCASLAFTFRDDVFDSFEDCCATHLMFVANSPCSQCSEDFWDEYLSSTAALERSFHPVCE